MVNVFTWLLSAIKEEKKTEVMKSLKLFKQKRSLKLQLCKLLQATKSETIR